MPIWGFRLAYAVGVLWLLGFEVWAVWLNKITGDTITDQVRSILGHPSNPLWWIGLALMLWAIYHLLVD